MPIFKCLNDKCKSFGKEELFPKVIFTWNSETMRLEASESYCPDCGEFREPIRENTNFENITFIDPATANYNNKKVKKYDWDRDSIKSNNIKI